MAWSVTIAGSTFTNANVDGNAYADEGTGFPAILAAIAREADLFKGVGTTSVTSIAAGTGSKALTLDTSPTWSLGAGITARSASDANTYMVGTVSTLSSTALSMAVTLAGGSTANDWVIGPSLAGAWLEKSGGTMSGAINMNGLSVTNATIAGSTTVASATALKHKSGHQFEDGQFGSVTSGVITINPTDQEIFTVVLAGTATLNIAPYDDGFGAMRCVLVEQEGSTGARGLTVKYNSATVASANWTGPTAGTPFDFTAQAAGKKSILSFFVVGSVCYPNVVEVGA